MIYKRVLLQSCLRNKRKRKREDKSNTVKESARIREIQYQKDYQSDESMDHISQLPDHIIHHILGFVRSPKDAVRTSTLSKKWRELWYSFSNLIAVEHHFARVNGHDNSRRKRKKFINYVYNSLQLHLENTGNIQKFVLHMISWDSEVAHDIDHWISVVTGKNIKELDLHFGSNKGICYTLPQTVFSAKTMTGLRLCSCNLESCNIVKLPRLQKLHLQKLRLDEHIIQNLISGCLSIEDLRLIRCSGLKYLQGSNLGQLNRVEIHQCNQLKKVELNAPNLHTFWYCSKKSKPCKVILAGCKSLKRLTLDYPRVTYDFCKNQLSNFPLLEKMDLAIFNNLSHITISNPLLQRLALKGCNTMESILVNSSNLLSFEYKGERMPPIEIHPFRLMNAKLSFEQSHTDCLSHNATLSKFIKKFEYSEGFKLIVRSSKNILIHEHLDEILLPSVPDFSIEIINSSVRLEEILDRLLRAWHPETLSIVSPTDSKFPKLVYEMIKNREEEPGCCTYNVSVNKCWRHFLTDIKFEDFESTGNLRTFYWLDSLDCLESASTLQGQQLTNLRLSWNPHQRGRKTQRT